MRSRHLLDPEFASVFQQMPTMVLSRDRITETRDQADGLVKDFFAQKDGLDGMKLSERMVPGAPGDPDVRILILEPGVDADQSQPRPAIFEAHGGGHVMGNPEMSLALYGWIARELGATMVMVDYRLSPETQFPGPLEDCYAAFKWMIANAGELNIDLNRVGVFGTSAGGTLAAGVALLARDRDAIPIAHLHLIQPMLDDRTVVDSDPSPYVGEYVWTRESNAFGWEARLGVAPGSEDISPYAAPGRMEDLSGLPPTFIMIGAMDLFADEDLQFARRLIRCGVPTEVHVYPGSPHGAPAGSQGPLGKKINRDDLAAWQRAFQISES